MKNREIKFKRAHFDEQGVFIRLTEWGFIDRGFASPASVYGEDKKRAIDLQFTGLHDKNGKEIYEGDIVIKTNYGKKVRKDTGVVKYYEPGACFLFYNVCYTNLIADNIELEIIGNVYQHTELLK